MDRTILSWVTTGHKFGVGAVQASTTWKDAQEGILSLSFTCFGERATNLYCSSVQFRGVLVKPTM